MKNYKNLGIEKRITEDRLLRIHQLHLQLGRKRWDEVKAKLGFEGKRVNELPDNEAKVLEFRLNALLTHRRRSYRQKSLWETYPEGIENLTED